MRVACCFSKILTYYIWVPIIALRKQPLESNYFEQTIEPDFKGRKASFSTVISNVKVYRYSSIIPFPQRLMPFCHPELRAVIGVEQACIGTDLPL